MISVLGQRTTLDQVRSVRLLTPTRAKRTWKGIHHGYLIDTLFSEFRKRGWFYPEHKLALSKDGADLAAAFDLHIPGVKVPKGQSLSLGLLTSNAMRRALKLVVGTTVTVCCNGMVTGEILVNKRHTIGVDIQDELSKALDLYVEKASKIEAMVNALQRRELDEGHVAKILIDAAYRPGIGKDVRGTILPWSNIPKVLDEYNNPRFKEFKPRTSWSLLNAFSWVVKNDPPLWQMSRIDRFRAMLPSYPPMERFNGNSGTHEAPTSVR